MSSSHTAASLSSPPYNPLRKSHPLVPRTYRNDGVSVTHSKRALPSPSNLSSISGSFSGSQWNNTTFAVCVIPVFLSDHFAVVYGFLNLSFISLGIFLVIVLITFVILFFKSSVSGTKSVF